MPRFPELGVGLGYREPYHFDLTKEDTGVDFLEVIPENFLFARDAMVTVAAIYSVVMNSVELSLGSEVDIDHLGA